jgi:hypothetical protein
MTDRKSPRNFLSAEDMSLKTKKPISYFASPGGNPQITSLTPETVVASQKQIDDNLLAAWTVVKRSVSKARAAKPKDQRTGPVTDSKNQAANSSNSSQKKQKKASGHSTGQGSLDANVEKALEYIGGKLVLLTEKERFAVLTKLNGAFGFKPKERPTTTTVEKIKTAKPKVPPTGQPERDGFNETYSSSVLGKMLEATSKTNRKLAKSSKVKPATEFYELHRWLLSKKFKARESGTVYQDAQPNFEPEKCVDQLLGSFRAIGSVAPSASPESKFDLGWCLIRGEPPKVLLEVAGKIPSSQTWDQVARFVPRTDKEAEKRASEILASKKTRKQKSKGESDNQTPPAKRPKATKSDSKEPATSDSSESESAVEMEEENDS